MLIPVRLSSFGLCAVLLQLRLLGRHAHQRRSWVGEHIFGEVADQTSCTLPRSAHKATLATGGSVCESTIFAGPVHSNGAVVDVATVRT